MAARRRYSHSHFAFPMSNCSRLGGGAWITNGTEQPRSTNKASFGRLLCENIGAKYLEMKRGKQTWGKPSQCAATDVIYVCSTRATLDVLH